MSAPSGPRSSSVSWVLTVGIVLTLVVGNLPGAHPPSMSGGGGSTVRPNEDRVNSVSDAVSPGQTASVFSHTAAVNSGTNASVVIGPVSVYSHASVITSTSNATTPAMSVLAGSVVYAFVAYPNARVGGVFIINQGDSIADLIRIASSHEAQNYTEDLFASAPIPYNTTLRVWIDFAGTSAPVGGSVAAVDVAGSGLPTVDGVNVQTGAMSGNASVNVTTAHANDLLLLGVAGPGGDAPFAATAGETLLDTGNNTTGPGENRTGFGSFSAPESGTTALLSATLAAPGEWSAIGVGIVGCNGCTGSGNTTTPALRVLAGSVVCVFVGFVNEEIGGGYVSWIGDSTRDDYNLVNSTYSDQNYTEDLYVSAPIPENTTLNVWVDFAAESFGAGSAPVGGSVAAVDVVGSGLPTVDGANVQTGASGDNASVNVTTAHANDLLLLGVAGPGGDAPFAATAGETLLDTGSNTSGPWADRTGFGSFSALESGTTARLVATLAAAGAWTAVAVGIHLPTFPVTFSETGLPNATTWYVNITGGQVNDSTGSTISFVETNGTYDYTVATANKTYAPVSVKGSFNVSGTSVSESVKFALVTFSVTFTETGLPSGTNWTVLVNASPPFHWFGSTGSVGLPNGTYPFTIDPVTGYTANPSGGVITVKGAPTQLAVLFTSTSGATTSSGLPPAEAYALLGGIVAVVVVVALVVVLLRRRRKVSPDPAMPPSSDGPPSPP